MRKITDCLDAFIATKRVLLRYFNNSDLDDFYEYASDLKTTAFLTWLAHESRDQSERVLKNFYIGNENCFAIVDKDEEKCIGSICLIPDIDKESISFGIVLNKKHWNKGIGTEVIKYVINFAFFGLQANKVTAEHFMGNTSSGKMMQNAGMHYVGKGSVNGKDTKIYEIEKTEWKKKEIKVLCVNPPTITEVAKFAKGISYYTWLRTKGKFYEFVPGELLGVQCIQSYVQEHNDHSEIEILNGCVEEHTSVEQTVAEIQKRMPVDLVCISGPYEVFAEVLYIAKEIRKHNPNTKILYGQFFASLCYNDILNKYDVFDYLSVGYGEITISKVIKYLQNECILEDIPGLAYMSENGVIYNPLSRCDIDEIIKIKPTRNDVEKVIKSGLSISMFCSRGCPYRCSFCASGSLMGRSPSFRLRNPYDAVDELEELCRKYHIERITFVDDTFAPNTAEGKKQARIIAEEIIRRNIKVKIMIDSRIDCIERELFTLLYNAGVRYVYVGIEAASNQNLKEYNKGYEADIIREKLAILEDIGITAVYGFINFNPETTYDDLLSNIETLHDLKHVDPTMLSHEFIPYPGTDMTNRLLKDGLVVGDFPDYHIKYKDPQISFIKKCYDKLLARYTSFLFNMNKYPEFYINTYEEIYGNINRMFANYLRELVLAVKEEKNISDIMAGYEVVLKNLLKQILVEERKKGTL